MQESIVKIKALISNAQTVCNKTYQNEGKLYDYHSLKQAVVIAELKEALLLLAILFEDKTIEECKEAFLEHCRMHAQQNTGTCLSLTAMPHGVCNELHWNIAKHLFAPQTLGAMLEILAPEVKTLLACELEFSAKDRKKIQITLKKKSSQMLQESPSEDLLTHFIVVDSFIFDVRELEAFSFEMHQRFYFLLKLSAPALIEPLYQHNQDFKILKTHLSLVTDDGQLPFVILSQFTQELRLGGTQITVQSLASLEAQRAFFEFGDYLKALPSETKEILFALTGISKQKTLGEIWHDLEAMKCIETAATDLQAILDNPANQAVLKTKLDVTQAQLDAIEQYYNKKGDKRLNTTGAYSKIDLPLEYCQQILSAIVIHNVYDYLSLLLSFPQAIYNGLLAQAQIQCNPPLPAVLGQMLATGILNSEQLNAFNQAVIANSHRLGGMEGIFLNSAGIRH